MPHKEFTEAARRIDEAAITGSLALTDLNLADDDLIELDQLGNLINLTELDLSNNQLTTLSESLGNLTNLTKLNLEYNRFNSLPDWLGNLTNQVRALDALRSLPTRSTKLAGDPELLALEPPF